MENKTQMEMLFEELTQEDGEYGYSLAWDTMYVKNPDTGQFEHVEDPKHDTFEYDGISFYWYHAGNVKHPDTPTLIVSWIDNYRGDDWDEHEEEIDADADSIVSAITRISGGSFYDDTDRQYDMWKDAQFNS